MSIRNILVGLWGLGAAYGILWALGSFLCGWFTGHSDAAHAQFGSHALAGLIGLSFVTMGATAVALILKLANHIGSAILSEREQ
jgi:hypothetical protein